MLGPYWEPERRLVEKGYRPASASRSTEIPAPAFAMRLTWTFAQLAGFLGTWSPRKRYREAHGHDALELALPRLERAWGGADAGERLVVWPLAMRAFRL